MGAPWVDGGAIRPGMVVDFHPFGTHTIVSLVDATERTRRVVSGAMTATWPSGESITIEPGRMYRRVA